MHVAFEGKIDKNVALISQGDSTVLYIFNQKGQIPRQKLFQMGDLVLEFGTKAFGFQYSSTSTRHILDQLVDHRLRNTTKNAK